METLIHRNYKLELSITRFKCILIKGHKKTKQIIIILNMLVIVLLLFKWT